MSFEWCDVAFVVRGGVFSSVFHAWCVFVTLTNGGRDHIVRASVQR